MANHASAIKRHRQSRLRRLNNQSSKSNMRTLVRRLNEAVASGDSSAAREQLRSASVVLAKAASKGLIHSRNASRRTARMARMVARMQG